jgi:hypothetical protein
MICVGRVAVGPALAAALSVSATTASAEAVPPGHDGARYLLFASTDLWRHGGFLHGGVLWSPQGLDRDGFALKVMFGGGAYRYVSGALGNADVTGRLLAASVLPGWRFKSGTLTVTAFGGLDLKNHRLTPDDPSAGLRGGYAGLRAGVELWYEPSASTMAAADASVSTIGPSYSVRAAFGWRLFDRFYLGPETAAFASNGNYRQVRAGLHLTGFKTATLEWSAGLGWANDTDRRSSLYGKIGLIARR